jgi:hypothetical protein
MPLRARLTPEYDPVAGAEAVAVATAGRWARGLGRRIQVNARRRVPVRSGELKASIGFSVRTTGSVVRLDNFATSRHARWVHDGTRAHAIRPRNARALRFQAGGRTVFAAHVWHPGTRATNFLSNAVAEELARDNLT